MKTFFLLLLLSCFAMSLASAPSTQARRAEVSRYQARRLGLPTAVKNALKLATTMIITGAISCLYASFADKLNKIPFLRKKPSLKYGPLFKNKITELISDQMSKFIDRFRRTRRNLILRRRMGFFSDFGKGFAIPFVKSYEVAKDAVTGIKNGLVKGGKVAAKLAKKVAKGVKHFGGQIKALAMKLDKLTGGALSKGLANFGCPLVAEVLKTGLNIALTSLAFPPIPDCLSDALLAGCRKGVELMFKKQRILRRLATLKRELKQF